MGQNNGVEDSKIQFFLKAVAVTVDAQEGLTTFYDRLDYARLLIMLEMIKEKQGV